MAVPVVFGDGIIVSPSEFAISNLAFFTTPVDDISKSMTSKDKVMTYIGET